MMEEKKIRKSNLNKLFEELLKNNNRIFAPVEKDDYFCFAEIQSPDTCKFEGYRNTKISPKEMFFPQTEVLYGFRNHELEENSKKPADNKQQKSVIFGVRPCDAQAISFLDKVFKEEEKKDFIDPYYQEKREKTTVISLTCNKPLISCFCTSVNGRPDGEYGADVSFCDLGEDFLARPITEKGVEFIKGSGKWFENAKKSDVDKRNKIVQESTKKINSHVKTEKIKEKLDKSFKADFWNEIQQKCLGCGVCTFLCPTCHCFDITDEVETGLEALTLSGGKRMRCWDSCMYPLFTLHASGHNPRLKYKERMRQRVMHKFNYCPQNFKEMFCVGCGRCVRDCPVNLDIREVLKIANG
ncbi:MAG TPA: hypothetical protein ENH82_16830 [bacterium]|nr:hypothetical protein [bacterium]